MSVILLSINPRHIANILNGTKQYEFRKVRCKNDVSKILLYSTSPVMKIVGEADVSEVMESTPDELWNETQDGAGIDKDFFDKYFDGRSKAFAYKLENVRSYDEMKNLSDYGVDCAPQSFVYIN